VYLVFRLAAAAVLFPACATAQFQQQAVQAALPSGVLQAKVCDTSAFPPFNRHGPWSFDLCDGHASTVVSCEITASVRAKRALPAPMLRRALLRLIEEYEAGAGVEDAVHSALSLACVSLADQSSS